MSIAADPPRRSGLITRMVGRLLGWIVATLLVLTPVTAVIYLGWLMRYMRMVACRRAGLAYKRPSLIFGTGAWYGRLLGGLALNVREGFSALLSLVLVTAPFSIIWLLSWWAGWENSFSKGYEQAFVGPALGLGGVAVFCAIMIWLPMGMAHQAVEGRFLALFELRAVRSAVRHSGWGYLFLALATVIAALPLFAGRGLAVFASDLVPGFDAMTYDQIEALRLGILLALSAYTVVALWVLRGWSAALYARAIACALVGPEAEIWQNSTLARGQTGGRRPWKLTHWLRGLVLAIIWFGLAAQIFVGQFLNHDWHLWLTHPFLVLPWVG